jgi:hypothetical protein
MTVCPVCGVTVRDDRLNRHLQKVHGGDRQQSGTKINGKGPRSRQPGRRNRDQHPIVFNTLKRTGVTYDDETFYVEFEGENLGYVGSAADGWELIRKRREAQAKQP